MHTEAFIGDHFLAGHVAFGFHVQPDGQSLVVGGLNNAIDDFANQFAEMVKLCLAFRITDALLNDLARRLGCHPTKISRGALDQCHSPQFNFGIHQAGVLQADLGGGIFHAFHHFLLSIDGHLSGVYVDFGFHPLIL